ncbi:MAG: bifunctional precorrin-2 dehydrogenase/sirohydrochlorin ferrochelatase [Candidatus Sulfobium sp.]
MNYYPAFLDLRGKRAVIVGGGRIAERKILSLIEAGADVTVVSPSLTERLRQEKSDNRISHLSRSYRKGDLLGSFLVIAATDSEEINSRVAGDAPALVNVVDVPSECNFIAPSVVRRGPLTLAVSTGGASPAMAKTLRKELQKAYGPEFSGYLRFLKQVRAEALAGIGQKVKRERFLKGLASQKMVNMLRTKGLKAVKEKILERLRRLSSS